MKLSDRRLARRFQVAIPVYFRAWKSQQPEQKVESVNVSECGLYFETDTPPRHGAMIQVRIEMPTEITGHPPNEWLCTGKVVDLHPLNSAGAMRGVRVRFDYYEVSRTSELVSVCASSEHS
jgi:hypothetical protein